MKTIGKKKTKVNVGFGNHGFSVVLLAGTVGVFLGKRGVSVAAMIVELLVALAGWTLCFGLYTLQ